MKLRRILGVGSLFAALLFTPVSVMAASGHCPEGSLNSSYSNSIAECNVAKEDNLIPVITTIINVLIGVLGIVAVIVIIFAGIQFVTSSGDAQKVAKAKNTILYGVIGLLIALLAYPIVNFVLSSVFGS
jgi:hypothetical protein